MFYSEPNLLPDISYGSPHDAYKNIANASLQYRETQISVFGTYSLLYFHTQRMGAGKLQDRHMVWRNAKALQVVDDFSFLWSNNRNESSYHKTRMGRRNWNWQSTIKT